MPVRKIPKNYGNVTGVAAYGKAEGKAAFESTLERDFLTLLEFSPEVIEFEVQPLTVEWTDKEGRARKYTPDALVYYEKHSGLKPTVFEVKYRSDIARHWGELKPKFRRAIAYARDRGWRFKIATEVEIQTPLLENARFLLPFRMRPVSEEHMTLLDEALRKLRQSTPQELLRAVFKDEWNQAELLPALWYLVGSNQIECDLSVPLNMQTPLRYAS